MPRGTTTATTRTLRATASDAADTKDSQSAPTQQHLVLIGGGHAHAQVIKALHTAARPEHVQVTLIDPQAAATYSGMVPGCIAGVYDTLATAQLDIAGLAAWAGMHFVQDRVVDIDLDQRLIYTRNNSNAEQPIPYDAVSIDIGSASRNVDSTPGARQYTIPTRPIDALVRRLQRRKQEQQTDHDNDKTLPTRIVVVGGGVAGIELAMAVHAQFGDTSNNDNAATPAVHTTLLTASDTLLPEATELQRQTLYKVLDQQGIDVQYNAAVERVEEHAVVLEDRSKPPVPFDHCIWATGAAAHPLAFHLQQQRGLACTTHGWITVDATLQSTSHPGVFAAGDCAHIQTPTGTPPPKAGVYAVRAGPILVENLTRYLQDKEQAKLKTYQPQDDFLKLIVCSQTHALGLRFGLALYGRWVLQVKDAIDEQFMKLFLDLPTDTSYIQRGVYDTSQYDAAAGTTDPLANVALPDTPAEAAALLQRTDDNVDWKQAWLVLRTMTQDTSYRQQVLEYCDTENNPKQVSTRSTLERQQESFAQ